MIKGTQRRIVEIRLGKSKLYESACFWLRQGVGAEQKSERELLEEARAIVSALEPRGKRIRRALIWRIALCVLMLLIGAALGFGLALLL